MEAYNKFITPRGVMKYPQNGYIQQSCDGHKMIPNHPNLGDTAPVLNGRSTHADRENIRIYEENAMLRKDLDSIINKCRYFQDLVNQLKEELECEKKSASSFRRKSDMLEKELDTVTKTLYTVKQLQESEGRLQCQVEVLLTENKKLKLKESELITEVRQLKNEKDMMVMDYQRYAKQLHQIFNCKLEKKDKLCHEYESKLKEILGVHHSSNVNKEMGETPRLIVPSGARICPHDIPRLNLSSSSSDLLNMNSGSLEQDFSSGTDSLRKDDDTPDNFSEKPPVSATQVKSSINEDLSRLKDAFEKDAPSHRSVLSSKESNRVNDHGSLSKLSDSVENGKDEDLSCVVKDKENLNPFVRLKGGSVRGESDRDYPPTTIMGTETPVISYHGSPESALFSLNSESSSLLNSDRQRNTVEKKESSEKFPSGDDEGSLNHEASAEIMDILRSVNTPTSPFPVEEPSDKVLNVASVDNDKNEFQNNIVSSSETNISKAEQHLITISAPKALKCCLSSQSLHKLCNNAPQPAKRTHSLTSMNVYPCIQSVSVTHTLTTTPNSVWKRYTLMKNSMPAGYLKKTLDVLSFK